ncbi:MAG: hypothetical protein NT028_07495 [candidate division Zixibacteria bacterium]|nr:hypothetical protein [candidate division Zixibacteria bacterium]
MTFPQLGKVIGISMVCILAFAASRSCEQNKAQEAGRMARLQQAVDEAKAKPARDAAKQEAAAYQAKADKAAKVRLHAAENARANTEANAPKPRVVPKPPAQPAHIQTWGGDDVWKATPNGFCGYAWGTRRCDFDSAFIETDTIDNMLGRFPGLSVGDMIYSCKIEWWAGARVISCELWFFDDRFYSVDLQVKKMIAFGESYGWTAACDALRTLYGTPTSDMGKISLGNAMRVWGEAPTSAVLYWGNTLTIELTYLAIETECAYAPMRRKF